MEDKLGDPCRKTVTILIIIIPEIKWNGQIWSNYINLAYAFISWIKHIVLIGQIVTEVYGEGDTDIILFRPGLLNKIFSIKEFFYVCANMVPIPVYDYWTLKIWLV